MPGETKADGLTGSSSVCAATDRHPCWLVINEVASYPVSNQPLKYEHRSQSINYPALNKELKILNPLPAQSIKKYQVLG